MRPIRLGVIFDQELFSGGGYQQALNALLLTQELSSDVVDVEVFTTFKQNVAELQNYKITASYICLRFVDKLTIHMRRYSRLFKLSGFFRFFSKFNRFEKVLVNRKIDIVYFLSPSILARDLEELNYIMTVWDLCERDAPEFPEVRRNSEFEIRDENYRSILPKAVAVLVDSEYGKKGVVRYYGIDENRVFVIPFQAAQGVRGKCKVNLEPVDFEKKYSVCFPYVFYPAQFWAHKNHVYLLEGLRILEVKYGIRVGAVFSGGDKGNRQYIEEYSINLGLKDRVRFVGFVKNNEVAGIYRNAIALVMPTYFGPTNLPPLEAFELGVPVLYPDKPGLRDQVGSAALLMDLNDPGSMADHIKNLVNDGQLKDELIQAGKIRLAELDSVCRAPILQKILQDFRWRRMCWK